MRTEVISSPCRGSSAICRLNQHWSRVDGILPGRQLNMEDGTASWRVAESGRAAQPRDNALHDAQAEAGAAFLARIGRVRLGELLVDPGPEIGRNSKAVVAHRNGNAVAGGRDRNHHVLAGRRKL